MNLLGGSFTAVSRGLKRMTLATGTAWSLLWFGTRLNCKAAVGDRRDNPALMECVLRIARTFPDAQLRVSRPKAYGSLKSVMDHPMTRPLERPNPFYSVAHPWMVTMANYILSNAYWPKIRNNGGGIAETW